MKGFIKNISWLRYLVKKMSLNCLVLIAFAAIGQQAEAAVITYYYSEHCEICKAFEPAWNEFVANESANHTIKKKSTMDADNLQELTQLAQNIRGRLNPSIPSIYIEFENKTPILLMGSKEVPSLYQAVEPGTSKTINFVAPIQAATQSNITLLLPVTFAAAADAVNPCAIFVFILAVSYATIYSGKRKAILYGITFAVALYLTYFIAGMAGKVVISRIFNNANAITLIMSCSLFIVAGFHVRTVFFPQQTKFSELSDSTKMKLVKQAEKCVSVGGAAVSGALCAMIELPCTGGPYAFALSLLAKQSMYESALWLGYYNLIFISPILVLLCILVISPEKVDMFEQLRNKYRRLLHLAMALCLTAAGTWGLWHYY
ncbi:hypothetical protein [Sporomusa malonica]|uniref:Cytochrome c biogenesis protein CcdA n=2 Tax=Sporomusa malonica TaxID=112901 RepID=A0A1W2DMF5_9FIRM|nr:Cytochrome c biogenesis protein CcdA [Sporomusa malonica]